MSSAKTLFGFHAIGVRIKTAPASILEIHIEPTRRDARMRQFVERIKEAGIRLIESDGMRLAKLCGSHGHQGVVARVVGHLRHLLDASAVKLTGVQEDLRDRAGEFELHAQRPHVDQGGLAQRSSQQRGVGMKRLEVTTDGQGLADPGSVVQLEHGQLAQRVQLQERRCFVGVTCSVHLLARNGQALFGQEDAHPSWMHAGGEVVKQHGEISLSKVPPWPRRRWISGRRPQGLHDARRHLLRQVFQGHERTRHPAQAQGRGPMHGTPRKQRIALAGRMGHDTRAV